MRLLTSFVLASFTLLAFTACNSSDSATRVASSSTPAPAKPNSTPVTAAPSDGAPRITTTQLQDLISKGQAYVVDVRTEDAYNTGHVKGAKLIPYGEVVTRMNELPRDKTIVTYCSCANEHTAAGAVIELKKKGLENVVALLGGMTAWKNAGLPVDTGSK